MAGGVISNCSFLYFHLVKSLFPSQADHAYSLTIHCSMSPHVHTRSAVLDV